MILCITANIYIEVADDKDPEEIRHDFERGAPHALRALPGGDVIEADVVDGHTLTAEEISERGYDE